MVRGRHAKAHRTNPEHTRDHGIMLRAAVWQVQNDGAALSLSMHARFLISGIARHAMKVGPEFQY